MFTQSLRPELWERLAATYARFVALDSAFWRYGPEFTEPWDTWVLGFLGYCTAQIDMGAMAPFLIRQMKQKHGALHIAALQPDAHARACIDHLRMLTGGEPPLRMDAVWQGYRKQFGLSMTAHGHNDFR